MTFYKHSFENGSAGSNITTASSAGTGVTAFSFVSAGTGSTLTFDSTRAAHGTLSAKVTPVDLQQTLAYWTVNTTAMAWRGYFYLTATAPTDLMLVYVRGDSGRVVSVHLDVAGKAVIRDLDAGNQFTTTSNVPLNQWVRLELYTAVGNTTSNGVIKFGMYVGDSSTPIDTVYSVTNANVNSVGLTQVQSGKTNTSSYATTFWMDDLLVSDTATDLLGPYVANLPPTVTAGSDITVSLNAVASLTSSASDTDGTIASRLWTFDSIPSGASTPSITGSTSANASFTPTVAGTYVARMTATDDGGATGFDTMTVSVPGISVRPVSQSSNPGGWTNVGTAVSTSAALADELNSTWIATPSTPDNAAITFAVGVVEAGLITVKVKADIDTNVPGTVKVELLEGATVRSTSTFNVTTTIQDFQWTLTTSENNAITDRTNLFIRITGDQT